MLGEFSTYQRCDIALSSFRRWYTQIWVTFHTRALLVQLLTSGENLGSQNTIILKPQTLKTVGKSCVIDCVRSSDDVFDNTLLLREGTEKGARCEVRKVTKI